MGQFCDGGVRSGTSFFHESADRHNADRVFYICAQEARWKIVDMSTRTAVVLTNL
jgi:adenosyl cobinamide kinase/adenosyl cobinamide phosphate guanylyltransferase